MKKIVMLDVYGMEHVFDNHFKSLDEAEQWAADHGYRVSRQYIENNHQEVGK